MPDELFILEIFVVCALGLLFGSFASALVYRIPRDIPWIWESKKGACRSACTKCGYTLKFWDLIPLFSWLFLRGKCRSCSEKVSILYPLIEISTLTGFLIVYLMTDFSWDNTFIFLIVPFLVALLFIDLEHFILPDELVGIIAICGAGHLGLNHYNDDLDMNTILYVYIAGAALFAAVSWGVGIVMTKFLKKEALGFGDVKFFSAVGLWLGIAQLSSFMILSGLFGILFALVWKKIKKQDVFPFGPALIISFFILLFFDGSQFL